MRRSSSDRLKKHDESEWHLASVEERMLFLSAEQQGNVVEQIAKASQEENKENHELIKNLVPSLYFLVKNHITHTTMF